MEWWMSVSLHASTLFMMLTEVCLTRTIVYTRLVLPVFGLVLLYMLLTFVIYGTYVFFISPFGAASLPCVGLMDQLLGKNGGSTLFLTGAKVHQQPYGTLPSLFVWSFAFSCNTVFTL